MADQVAQNGRDDSKNPLDEKKEQEKAPVNKNEIIYENKIGEREKKTESKGERNNLKKDIKKPEQHKNQHQPQHHSKLPQQPQNTQEQAKPQESQVKQESPNVVPINPFARPEWKPESKDGLKVGEKTETNKSEFKTEPGIVSKQESQKPRENVKPREKLNPQDRVKPQENTKPKQESHKIEDKHVPINPFVKPEPVSPMQQQSQSRSQQPKFERKHESQKPQETIKPQEAIKSQENIKPQESQKIEYKKEDFAKVPAASNVPINPFARPEPVSPMQQQSQSQSQQPKSERKHESQKSQETIKPQEAIKSQESHKIEDKHVPINPFARPEPVSQIPPQVQQQPQSKPDQKQEDKPEPIKSEPIKSEPKVEPSLPPQHENKREENLPPQSPFAKESGESKVINPFEKQDTTKKAFVDAKAVAEQKHAPNPFEQDKKEAIKVEVIDGGAKKHSMPASPTVSAGKVEPVATPSPVVPDNFRSEFWDILEQAGITKGKLIAFAVVVVLGILVLLFFVLGWYKSFEFGFSIEDKQNDNQQVVVTDTPDEIDKIPVANSKAYGLISSYIFGVEYGKLLPDDQLFPIGAYGREDSILASLELGGARDAQKIKFVYYASLLRKMQNVFEVDIYTLLNQSTDRAATLNQYLLDFNAVISEGMIAYSEIDQQASIWFAEYDQVLKNQQSIESQFFNSLNNLTGESAYQSLGDFIKFSQQAVEIRGYANAYKSLRLMFINSLNVLRPRYSDVYYNREALTKGVKVIDIPGSDINAIIRASQ